MNKFFNYTSKTLIQILLLVVIASCAYIIYSQQKQIGKLRPYQIKYEKLHKLEVDRINRAQKQGNNIVLNTIMKSASDQIAETLSLGLGYDQVNIFSYLKPNGKFYENISQFFEKPNKLAKQHLQPPANYTEHYANVLDTKTYKLYSHKIIIHIRDPRQVILSHVYHMDKYPKDAPLNYEKFSLEQKMEWVINNLLDYNVKWILGWLDFKAQEELKADGMKILITTYDDFLKDEISFYKSILNFYDIPWIDFKYKKIDKTQSLHFRNGDPNEWREAFSKEQKDRIANKVPQVLLDRFNWNP